MPKLQSAYRRFHSTETALLRVCNDILLVLDCRQEVVLFLLDLSSVFDTIDHDVLLDRLRSRYGIKGTALNWFRPYLSNRTESVRVGDSSSSNRTLKYGVPQGSVLGPILFSLFFTYRISDSRPQSALYGVHRRYPVIHNSQSPLRSSSHAVQTPTVHHRYLHLVHQQWTSLKPRQD